jgi:hypothetical protein
MSKFSPGEWDWWLRQPEARVHQETGRTVLSVPTSGRLSRLIANAQEMCAWLTASKGALEQVMSPAELIQWRNAILARIDGDSEAQTDAGSSDPEPR